jgi:hypothetical protein
MTQIDTSPDKSLNLEYQNQKRISYESVVRLLTNTQISPKHDFTVYKEIEVNNYFIVSVNYYQDSKSDSECLGKLKLKFSRIQGLFCKSYETLSERRKKLIKSLVGLLDNDAIVKDIEN